jgi:hypothetical protein
MARIVFAGAAADWPLASRDKSITITAANTSALIKPVINSNVGARECVRKVLLRDGNVRRRDIAAAQSPGTVERVNNQVLSNATYFWIRQR